MVIHTRFRGNGESEIGQALILIQLICVMT